MILFLLITTFSAHAQEVHFFGSIDYAKTTTKNDVKYGEITNTFSATNLETAGINVSSKFNEHTQGLVQVIHLPVPNKVSMDLIQLQRTFNSDFKVRVGKQRMPTFLKSEVIQVKALYPWLNPPVQLYEQVPIRSFTGVSLEKGWGDFMLHLYGGSINEEFYRLGGEFKIEGSNLHGARLSYGKNSFESFINFTRAKSEAQITADVPLGGGVFGEMKSVLKYRNSEIFSLGASHDSSRWLFLSEYLHIVTANATLKTVEAIYGSVGYRLTEKLLTLATVSTDLNRKAESTPSSNTSYDLSTQYSIDENISLKIGFTHVNYQRKNKPATLSATGFSDSAIYFSGAPGGNFDIYDLQLAFVF